MKASQEMYKEVAQNCSSYTHVKGKNCFCNEAPKEASCLNCEHFDSNEHCNLDLYDRIAEKIQK